MVRHRYLWCVSLSGAGYYMALSGLVGETEDVARLKLLLSDRTQQAGFCLMFDYRVLGQNVGTLKVLLENSAYPVWEQSQSREQGWQTELLSVAWKEKAPQSVSSCFCFLTLKILLKPRLIAKV